MIRRSPAEFYLKFLIAHPSCYDNTYISEVSKELGLDVLGAWYLQWLRDRVQPPKPFYPEVPGHKASERFLAKEQLRQAYLPDDDMDAAMRILMRPRIREQAETLVISGAPNSAVVLSLARRFQFRSTENAIRLYKHYFWNIDLLDTTQLRALLDMRHDAVLGHPDKDIKDQYKSLNRMHYTDPRVVASRVTQTPVMSMVAQMNAGIMPKRMDVAAVVNEAFNHSIARLAMHTSIGGRDDAQIAQTYAVTAEILQRLKETVRNPEDGLREDLHRISVATTTKKVPTLKQLTDGNHTVSLQPDPVSEESPDEPQER